MNTRHMLCLPLLLKAKSTRIAQDFKAYNVLIVQGALWVYESILNPGLRRARTELTKFPALEKAITQFDQTMNAPVGVCHASLYSM